MSDDDNTMQPLPVADALAAWLAHSASSRAHVALSAASHVADTLRVTAHHAAIAGRCGLGTRKVVQDAAATTEGALIGLLVALAKEADDAIDPTYLDHFRKAGPA